MYLGQERIGRRLLNADAQRTEVPDHCSSSSKLVLPTRQCKKTSVFIIIGECGSGRNYSSCLEVGVSPANRFSVLPCPRFSIVTRDTSVGDPSIRANRRTRLCMSSHHAHRR
uniref:Uncharacterized protein n=1 Tax=Peronospora matthiolae TaxID=2874970 RepID=A0AAV1VFL6_9STRA